MEDTPLKKIADEAISTQGRKKKKDKVPRPFDFSKHSRRHIALQLVYLGWDYHGYTVQDTTDKTVEAVIFPALIQTRLIESRETSCYHRCGRTDKGVSAFGQVISITVRSALCTGKGLIRPGEVVQSEPKCNCGKNCSDDKEIPFTRMLNRALPADVKILAWSPAPIGFSARFDCTSRMYHYTFPAPDGLINFKAMQEGASEFVGTHDFRNFCRADQTRAGQSFCRDVMSASVERFPAPSLNQPPFGKFEIVGSSFLWHQVRCLMTVLLAIGKGEEEVGLVELMLDPQKTPEKPAYAMAADFPLVLAHCAYSNHELVWREDKSELARIADHFEKMWTQFAVQTSLIGDLVRGLRERSDSMSMLWSGSLKAFLPPSQPRIGKSWFTGKKRILESAKDKPFSAENSEECDSKRGKVDAISAI